MEQTTPVESTIKRCADCGTPMGADSQRVECKHCQKCAWPSKCSHNHDQWPKQ
jgi:reverse gyrase